MRMKRGGFASFLLPAHLRPMRLAQAVHAVDDRNEVFALAGLVAAGGLIHKRTKDGFLEARHGLSQPTTELLRRVGVTRLSAKIHKALKKVLGLPFDDDRIDAFIDKNLPVLLDSPAYAESVAVAARANV